jgi:dUTPase
VSIIGSTSGILQGGEKPPHLVIASERYPRVKEERISSLATAMIHEAVEVQRLTNWKWWKPIEFDQVQAKEEVIDLWHFLIQMSIELDMTPKEILNEYLKKHQITRNDIKMDINTGMCVPGRTSTSISLKQGLFLSYQDVVYHDSS